MPRIEVIKASEAPELPKKVSTVADQLLTALKGLKKDEVLKLRADEGKSLRGLKTSVGRITSYAGVTVTSWDDGTHLYVQKSDK